MTTPDNSVHRRDKPQWPSPDGVPPPPTSVSPDDKEIRSNLLIISLLVLLVLLILLTVPAAFDWKGKPMTSELNSKLDLVTGALLGIFGDSLRRASHFGPRNNIKDD